MTSRASDQKKTLPLPDSASTHDNTVDVNVDAREVIGVAVLGLLFFLVLLALLRSQKRERRLLRELADLHRQLNRSSL